MDAEEHVKNPYKGKKLKVSRGVYSPPPMRGSCPHQAGGRVGAVAVPACPEAARRPWAQAKLRVHFIRPDAALGACIQV